MTNSKIATRPKTLLFSLTQKDFEFQTFCTGGPGGQHKNAKQNGVRVIHPASGAVAEHRDSRDQRKNKEEAFRKIAETKKFKAWHATEVARRLGKPSEIDHEAIKRKVDELMKNIKVEEYDSISDTKV